MGKVLQCALIAFLAIANVFAVLIFLILINSHPTQEKPFSQTHTTQENIN